jgi:predicted nucleic acid-binding Zn ribbon protein
MSGARPDPKPLKDALERVLLDFKKAGNSPKNRVNALWPLIVGPRISQHTKPYALRRGVLFVRVDDSTWAQELGVRYRSAILRRLKKEIGAREVNDVRFRVGEL